MSDDKKSIENLESNQKDQTNETRRRLTKAGLASVPVILTLSSRPVWGGNYGGGGEGAGGACTISGMLSGNLSNHQHEEGCEGCTPGYWKTNPGAWPAPFQPGTCDLDGNPATYGQVEKDYLDAHPDEYSQTCYSQNNTCKEYNNDGTKFHDVFTGSDYGDETMMQVMWKHPGSYGFHLVGAILNAAHNSVKYGYTPAEIIALYDNADDLHQLGQLLDQLNNNGCPLPADNSYTSGRSGR